MRVSAHEKFITKLRVPVRRYENSICKKASDKTHSKFNSEEEFRLSRELEKGFNKLFGFDDSDDEEE